MAVTFVPLAPDTLGTFRALLADTAIAPQFDKFQGAHGLEHKLADGRLRRDGIRLAFVHGEPAGFAFAWLLPGATVPWAMLRAAVLPAFRRRGIGTALVREVTAWLRAREAHERVEEVCGSAWMEPARAGEPALPRAQAPDSAGEADAFAASLGFTHDRYFWLMTRPRGTGVPQPQWPQHFAARTFDGSDGMLHAWGEAYNDSFAQHYRFVRATPEDVRRIVADPTFRSDGLALAYRGGDCVGFCRCELHAERGEIAVLGSVRAARGLGLGRALLRWGVAWLERHSDTPVTLLVDGENEGALGLYRSEGFKVTRTRRVWAKPLERA